MEDSVNLELAQRIVDFLNELVDADRAAIAAMLANRVPCNEELAAHPTVQVIAQHGGHHVGMLGVLNGLCGVNKMGWGPIAAVYTDSADGDDSRDLVRFAITPAVLGGGSIHR